MQDFLSAARVSELIGCLYDCAIEPQSWEHALDAIREALEFKNAVLAAQALPSGQVLLAVQRGMPAEFLAPKSSSCICGHGNVGRPAAHHDLPSG